MTVGANYTPQNYSGDGTTTNFAAPWPAFAASDLVVTVTVVATGVATTAALNSDYTVSGTPDTNTTELLTSTVVFASPPAAGTIVTIARAVPATQPSAFPNAGPLPSGALEAALDRNTMVVQQAQASAGRAIRLPYSDTANSVLPAAAQRALSYLMFDASGNVVVGALSPNTAPVSASMQPVVAAVSAAAAMALLGAPWGLSYSAGLLTIAGALTVSGAATLSTTPTFPTAPPGDASTKGATTAFVAGAVNTAGVQGGWSGLKISTVGVSNFVANITANSIALYNSVTGQYYTARNVSLSPNISSNGIGGLSTGSLASNTWYYLYVGWNGAALGAWFDPSSSAPTVPSGYNWYARVGAVRTDGSGNKYLLCTLQLGREVQYVVTASSNTAALPIIASGSGGSTTVPTWASWTPNTTVPPTASHVDIAVNTAGATSPQVMVAPNNSYGAYNSASNPPPIVVVTSNVSFKSRIMLETNAIYYASNVANAYVYVAGWTDNL